MSSLTQGGRPSACDMVSFLDISESRLKFAKQLGADFVLTVEPGSEPRSNADAVASLIQCRPDVTIECSGAESSLQTAVYVRL